MSSALTPPANTFIVSESSGLTQFRISTQQYFNSHPDVHCLVAAAMVFHSDRVLLLQRSPQEQAYAHHWEIPGGSCDKEDLTILHSAARELFEETGLHISQFNRQIGKGLRFETGDASRPTQWLKLSFDVDVSEAKSAVTQQQLDGYIKLDPMEHQHWLWATEHEVQSSRAGEVELNFISPELRLTILDGFAQRKSRSKEVEAA